MAIFSNQNLPNSCSRFYCDFCDYKTSKKSSYDDHLLTRKHQKSIISNQKSINGNQNLPKNCSKFICQNCNKEYKDYSGLWRHKKKCNINNDDEEETILDNFELSKEQIFNILKHNNELQQMLMEQNKTIIELSKNNQINSNNTTTTNSHNKAFNLNFFLNETCKDAMNIMDFVDSIKLQLCDLERVGEKGFVEGISNIIIKNLKDLDISKRPVHCTDKKREVLYVKDEDKWEKEDTDNKKVRKAIKHIASKNSKMLNVFREKYPDCIKSTSKYSDAYNKLVLESFGGYGNEDNDNENKIIKKISQEVLVEKG
jgi:hypothetical protein